MVATTKMKSIEELIENLSQTLETIKYDDEKIDRIKRELKEYKVLPGNVIKMISDTKELKETDRDLLYLFTHAVYLASGDASITPEDYFNDREIKEIRTTFRGYESDEVKFPYTFHNVIKGADDNFTVYSDGQTVTKLRNSKLLQYNFNTQREARFRKNSPVPVIKVVESSVKAIEDLVLKNKFDVSTITLNARLDTGMELEYDEKNHTLTVNEGTLLDVLDGFHRITGISRAIAKNPSVNPIIILNIVHYDEQRAKDKFVQINTTNRVSESHKKKLSESRQADFIARRIQDNTDLRNVVFGADNIAKDSNFVVTFKVLSDAIDEVYDITDKPTAIKESNYLIEFFNELIMYNYDAFISNIAEIRNDSLLNANSIFYGYILLSKRMKDENIGLNNLKKILDQIDFSRENKKWQELGILNDQLNITNRAKQQFYKFFKDVKLS